MYVRHPKGSSMKKKAQPQPKAPQAEDLDLETIHLRRSLAECEVARNRLEMENGDLIRELKNAKAALNLGEQRLARAGSTSESLIVALKAKADESDDIRLRLEKSEANAAGAPGEPCRVSSGERSVAFSTLVPQDIEIRLIGEHSVSLLSGDFIHQTQVLEFRHQTVCSRIGQVRNPCHPPDGEDRGHVHRLQ